MFASSCRVSELEYLDSYVVEFVVYIYLFIYSYVSEWVEKVLVILSGSILSSSVSYYLYILEFFAQISAEGGRASDAKEKTERNATGNIEKAQQAHENGITYSPILE